jgi:hypothetical protein
MKEGIMTHSHLNLIRKIGEMQSNRIEEGEESLNNIISFEFKKHTIVNPFLDVTGRCEVDPIIYYGDSFLNSDFCK